MSGGMRPLYINGRFLRQSLTGVQRFATEMTAALGRAGVAPILLVPPGPALDDIPGVTIRVVGKRQGQMWEQWELPRFARDGILLNLGNMAPLWLRRQIVVIHDCGVFATPEAYGWKFRAWYKFAQRVLVRSGARIVTVSEFSKSEIVRHLGARAQDVTVIPEGADHMHRIAPDPTVLTDHALTPGQYVLAVGSLAAHKNLAILGDLAVALQTRGMVLAITGGLNPAVFQVANGTTLPHPARYLGRVTDNALRALYENAACLVFPSRYEGFGLPVIEAMACGCPVVCSDIPALREVCGEGATLVPPNLAREFATKTMTLLTFADHADTIRQAAAGFDVTYNWDRGAAIVGLTLRYFASAETTISRWTSAAA